MTLATIAASHPRAPTRLDDRDLESLLLIRRFEETLLELFAQGLLSGTTHTCLGQEHVPVAMRTLLEDGDFVFSNHRGHGHFLARFDDPHGLLAEIMGRDGAVCNGVGGSQHILRERYVSTGIQGESLPVAAGVALHLKRSESGRLAAAYIGDGTWGEGAVYEALNLAALWTLPLLVIVEHNGIAQTTPTARGLAGTIGARAEAFGVRHVRIDSLDVGVIRSVLAPLVERVRDGGGPLIAEFRTPRLGPHSKGDDTREPAAIEHAREHDWLRHYTDAFPDQVAALDDLQRRRVTAVVDDVVSRPPSTWEAR